MKNWSELIIQGNIPVIEAAQILDKALVKTLFIVHENKLQASFSNGDLRRWILSGRSMDEPVLEAANRKPRYILEGDEQNATEMMMKNQFSALPVIDQNQEIVNIFFWNEAFGHDEYGQIDLPVVIMAGGKGTRLYPYTHILPKALIPIGEIPIIERIIDNFSKVGCHTFYIIINHKGEMIRAYFSENNKKVDIHFVQEDKPLGTGGGLSLLKGIIDTPFLFSNCDILLDVDFSSVYKLHVSEKNKITMITSLKNHCIPYGVIELSSGGIIKKINEKPTITSLVNTGVYILEPDIVQLVEDETPVSFISILDHCMNNGMKVGAYPINESSWMDMGEPGGMEKMNQFFERQENP